MAGQHHKLNGHEFEQILRQLKTEKPDVLQSTKSQTVRHDLASKQQKDIYQDTQAK